MMNQELRRIFLILNSELQGSSQMAAIKSLFNVVADPRVFFVLAVFALFLVIWQREKIAANAVGYGTLGILGLFFAFGTFDPNFRLIVTKPDNVPIVGLIFM